MFGEFFSKRRAAKEAEELRAIQARDACAGVPTQGTLKERFDKAARESKWSIVDDCVQKGCSYSDPVAVSNKRRDEEYFEPFRKLAAGNPLMPFGARDHEVLALVCLPIMTGDIKALETLLSRGATPNPPKNGYSRYKSLSPLELAVGYNLPEAAKLLCDHGVDFSYSDALKMAETWNNIEIIKIIRAEEARRKGAPPPDPAQLLQEKMIHDLHALPPEKRDKVLGKLCDEFGAVRDTPPAAALQDDLQVPKPITLKTGARPAP
ncbi:MAG: hypothetical protein ACAH80_01105 [Alphaproteobacteria bacterium]